MDLVDVVILGQDCLMTAQWLSHQKITALCPGNTSEREGDIIIVTGSGGRGTCNVPFRVYREKITPLTQVSSWIPEKVPFSKKRNRNFNASNRQDFDDALQLSVKVDDRSNTEFLQSDVQFENKSTDIRAPNFDPTYFLLSKHGSTPFEDLKLGMNSLQRKVDGENENQLSFIKSNVGCIIEQLDTLRSIRKKHQKENDKYKVDTSKGSGSHLQSVIGKVEKSMVNAKQEADQMFSQVLERKDTADATRNALYIMNRFKFVFYLPSNLEYNLRKGDFDRIIDEYERAVTLYGNSESEVFKKYLAEIQKGIDGLKDQLNKLIHENLDLSVEQQKKLISNLVQIDTDCDPAWNCLQLRYNNLLTLMGACDERREHSSDTGRAYFYSEIDLPPNCSLSNVPDKAPAKILSAERLTKLIAGQLPDIWRLGQAYFKGDLAVVPGSGKQVVFKEMVLGSIRYYSTLIRETMSTKGTEEDDAGHDEAAAAKSVNEEGPWLIYCLRFVRFLHTVLIELDLPREALVLIVELLTDLRICCLQVTFQILTTKVNGLGRAETWKQDITDAEGAVTKLPVEFLSICSNSVPAIKEVTFQGNDHEQDILADTDVVASFKELLLNAMGSFAFTLEYTAVDDESSENSPIVMPSDALKLLICMNNCNYTLTEVLPKIKSLYQSMFENVCMEEPYEGAAASYDILRQKLLETYIDMKVESIVDPIEPNMYSGKFDWARCPKPRDAKDYVKGIVHDVTAVYGELERTSPKLAASQQSDEQRQKIMDSVAEAVAEEIDRLFSCINRMNSNGCIQAWVDINCLRIALRPFLNSKAVKLLEEASKPLLDLERPGDRETVRACEDQFNETMKFHLSALIVS